jgi:hypothetical protein
MPSMSMPATPFNPQRRLDKRFGWITCRHRMTEPFGQLGVTPGT